MNEKTGEGGLLKDDLSNYSAEKYKKPSVTVDIIICTILDGNLRVLLIKRKHPPYRGSWAIPGGFVDIDKNETLEEAAFRELREETNITKCYLEQLKTYGDPDRDPRTRVITVAHYALIPYEMLQAQNTIKAGDDAAETAWFSLHEIEKGLYELAFDHRKILTDALNRLKGKLWYSPIAFGLLPEKFTWNGLKKVYEAILGKKIDAHFNFRRKINVRFGLLGMKSYLKGATGRPSRYLKFLGSKEAY